MPSFLVWSDWRPLALSPSNGLALSSSNGPAQPEVPTPAVLAEVLDGGQTFRWSRTPDGVWQGVWSDCVARLKPSEQGGLLWSAPQTLADAVVLKLPQYFATTVSFAQLADALPWRSEILRQLGHDRVGEGLRRGPQQ
ncbi:MAG: DNA glycosylase, partial [Bryobacteraceae bacterium]